MVDTSSEITIEIDQESREALQTNLTVRFLLHVKKTLDYRDMDRNIAWAGTLVQEINAAILKAIDLEAKSSTHQLNQITLFGEESVDVYICYDIFIDGCDEARKAYIDQTVEEQPIHSIEEESGAYHVSRAEWRDGPIAKEYERLKQKLMGRRPFYALVI